LVYFGSPWTGTFWYILRPFGIFALFGTWCGRFTLFAVY
jgi:hypothetical protein